MLQGGLTAVNPVQGAKRLANRGGSPLVADAPVRHRVAAQALSALLFCVELVYAPPPSPKAVLEACAVHLPMDPTLEARPPPPPPFPPLHLPPIPVTSAAAAPTLLLPPSPHMYHRRWKWTCSL